jgi:phospholipid/cholesterol/gamma-HCH transport system permease protein
MMKTISMPPSLTRDWIEKEGKALALGPYPDALTLDLSRTTLVDSAGTSLLLFLGRRYEKKSEKLTLVNVSAEILAGISSLRFSDKATSPAAMRPMGLFETVGSALISARDAAESGLSMLAEILYWASFGMLVKRDTKKGALEEQMFAMGYKALGIVALLSFLIGVVLALQAALQLAHFGAGIFLAPMITISMIKELGPLLTAIILTGRSGSAITAEIATMVVGEEIDALRTMGINPLQFVVVPKLFALSITMPALSLAASLVGIFAGYAVAVVYLGIASKLMIGEIMKNIFLMDVVANVVKSVVFSWLIVWIGAFHGFRVHGGAEAVGRETTQSMVNGIFIIICADAIFSFIF